MTEVVKHEAATLPQMPQDGAPVGGTMMFMERLLTAAVDKQITVEAMEKLTTLYREERAHLAAQQFADDFAEFQRACPSIPKTSHVDFTTKSGVRIKYDYAELDEIMAHVGPKLHPLGFSISWDSELSENGKTTAICTLFHRAGHARSARFSAPLDGSAHMNVTQQHASALQYAKRHSLIQVLGLTTTEPDTDVREEAVELITADQVAELRNLLAANQRTEKQLLDWLKRDTMESMTQGDYRRAITALPKRAT